MYLYKIGYGSYEESPNVLLHHERSYTKEEFQKLVIMVSVQIVKEKLAANECVSNYGDIYWDVAKKLISDYGFIKATPQADFEPFGWASIFDNSDWNHDRDDELKALTNALNELGYDKQFDKRLKNEEKYEVKEDQKS